MTIERRRSPWDDYRGRPLHDGDRIVHPTGEVGTIRYIGGQKQVSDRWRVDYDGGGGLSFLCIQVGDKGQGELHEEDRR